MGVHLAILAALVLPIGPSSPESKVQADGATPAPVFELQEISQARPRVVTIELLRAEPGRLAVTVRFRVRESNVLGELKLDLWNDLEGPIVEANYLIGGERHIHIRHADGVKERDQVLLSPSIRDELARGAPELMLVFWAVLTDPRVHARIAGQLSTLPPDPLAKNPACGVTKWGLKAVVWIAQAACCGGGFGACAVCYVGGGTALDALNGIDCNKECRPDCPIG
ncbi:hypothetical protein [Nannocystis sp. SCPEA4]|uniref:hypothetical protein n=1 Tax=Nannocystis sp. SCPEA4 TaxID=2996787 RepID=UPI00226FE82B|nr:hypothetical protein [Nannocystis sp. SCPEA4]MCY1060328.1 hypothetical protein [Nannocystis sp. SCPEA4]